MKRIFGLGLSVFATSWLSLRAHAIDLETMGPTSQPQLQYHAGAIAVPAFKPDEALRPIVSVELAETFLRDGALAWKRSHGCISCHTTGTYMVTAPRLSPDLGAPLAEVRDLCVTELRAKQQLARAGKLRPLDPAKVIYIAAGLADWDRYVSHRPSPETAEALTLMFELQLPSGGWNNATCWPPLESDGYHLATQAAMAVASSPQWLQAPPDPALLEHVNRLRTYLRTTPPAHDHSRTLLLWAAARMPELLTPEEKSSLIEMLWSHQRPDGGWSLRTFATPEAWGRGNRAGKLRGEAEFNDPPSDGHQTGLAIIVLRESGVPVSDPRLQRGVAWLKTHQRASGRWWTRSLNTDKFHYITYSGTAYPLLALSLCGELPRSPRPVAAR